VSPYVIFYITCRIVQNLLTVLANKRLRNECWALRKYYRYSDVRATDNFWKKNNRSGEGGDREKTDVTTSD
jgi:hypothetical protein